MTEVGDGVFTRLKNKSRAENFFKVLSPEPPA